MDDCYYLTHFLCAKDGDQLPLRLQGNLDIDPNDEQDFDDLTIPEER